MTAHWQPMKIGDFLTLEYGKPLDKSKRKDGGLYPAYGANGVKCWTDEFYSDTPTIIIGRKGSAGELTLTEEKYWPLDVTYFLKFDDKKYDRMFVYHLLSLLDLPSLATGVKPGINRNNVYAIETLVPDLEEQKRIVAILDQAFADIDKARALTEQNLKNARELFESTLQKVFSQRGEGWGETTLGEVSEVSSGGTPIKSNKRFWDGDIPWYSSGELNDTFTADSKAKITQAGLEGSNAKLFPKGSLLIGMYDTAALKMSLLDRDGAFNQAIAGVKPNSELDLEFVLHSINYIKPELLKLRRGVRQKNLNQSKIKSIPLWLPSIDQQHCIVTNLRKVKGKTDELARIYSDKLVRLEELKKSLLQKAFSGELTNASEEAAA